MNILPESLVGSIKGAIGGKVDTDKVSSEKSKSTSFLKISAKNFLSISGIARDLNVAKRNVEQLVEIMGGKPRKGDQTDAFFLKEDERERKLEVERKKGEEKKPEPVKPKKKRKGLFDKIKEMFSASNILKTLGKYLVIGSIVYAIFLGIKDTFVEWVSSLWKSIKESFDEFVLNIREWFNEIIQPIIDNVKNFIEDYIIRPISSFFEKVSNFIKDYFQFWKDLITNPIETMAKVWENFMSIVNKAVEKFQEWKDTIVEYYAKLPNWAKALVPAWLEKQLGLVETKEQKQERETRQAKRKETKTEEKKKEEQEQKAKADAEKKRVEERASKQQKAREETKREIQKEREVKKQPTPAPAAGAPAEAAPSAAPTPAGKPATSAETKPKKLSSETGKKSMISEMDRAKIIDPTARAAIMAQVGHESGNFTTLSENLNYKPATLLKIFPKYFKTPEQAQQTAAAGPEAIANKVYGGRMGNAPDEGFKYRGRGFIQLTGKDNYKRFGYASNPDDVSNPDAAAETAIKFMMGYKGDWSNITKVTKFVNGGTIGLADREKHFKEYLNDPSITKVGAVASAPSGGGMAAASTSVAADQRAQQKPATPNVINAPTTNNQVVKTTEKTPVVAKDSSRIVTARAA